jgi:hypothetical protein
MTPALVVLLGVVQLACPLICRKQLHQPRA